MWYGGRKDSKLKNEIKMKKLIKKRISPGEA
jgi:hypothetical protein